MFEDMWLYLLLMIVSSLLSVIIWKKAMGKGIFETVIAVLSFIGVVIHELSHYIACLVMGIKPKGIQIFYKFRGIRSPGGAVEVSDNLSFMQSLVISLAPLVVSAWAILFIFDALFYGAIQDVALFFILLMVFFSLFLGASPSGQDLKMIGKTFNKDPRYSTIQILIVVISTLLSMVTLLYFKITLVYDFLLYFIVAGFYFGIKYSYFLTRKLYRFLFLRNAPISSDINYKKYVQKRHKPTSPMGNKYKKHYG